MQDKNYATKLNRREFISCSSLALGGFLAQSDPEVMTVTGRVKAKDLGPTLMHEHVLVDFIGAEKVNRERYKTSEVFETALPHLNRVYSAGCRTFVECTPNWLGRDAALCNDSADHLVSGSSRIPVFTVRDNICFFPHTSGSNLPNRSPRTG